MSVIGPSVGVVEDLVLASGSPRRRKLLDLLGVPYRIVAPDIDETPRPGEAPIDLVARLGAGKAEAVGVVEAGKGAGGVVLAADTVVDVDGVVFAKPVDDADARRMLAALSGRTHLVHTGVAVRRDASTVVEVATTAVRIVALTATIIDWYVATGEPGDKAGAYAIQGVGGQFVASIEGSPSNVIGLPLDVVSRLLGRWDHGPDWPD